jgi:hypothetical protein
LGLPFSRRLDELIRALARKLPQPDDARKRVLLVGGRLVAGEALGVSLLGSHKVLERGGDGAVRSGRGQQELLLGQLRADVKQVKVRPPVIPESLDPGSIQSSTILEA